MNPVILRHIIHGQPFAKLGERRVSKNGWFWECTRLEAVQQVRGPMAGWWLWEAEFTPILSPKDIQLTCESLAKEMPRMVEAAGETVAAFLKSLNTGDAA